jgi:transcriptional regulator of arginine metabolism
MAKSRKERLAVIKELIQHRQIGQQEELVRLLMQRGFESTQATVSRDLKMLQITKTTLGEGGFIYALPPRVRPRVVREKVAPPPPMVLTDRKWMLGVISLERSQTLVVIRTKPGYAGSIASDLDSHELPEVMGTIAGDDTILVIPRMGYKTEQVAEALLRELAVPE